MEGKKALAIDTSDRVCSVAISENGKVLVSKSIGDKLSHAESLMPLIESAFLEVDFSVKELDYIFVVAGPGSFTGIRIGVATAKALAQFNDIKIVEVMSLVNLAKLSEIDEDCILVPLIDARRKTYYMMMFDNNYKNLVENVDHIEFDEILEKALKYNKKVYFVGDNLTELLKDYSFDSNVSIIDTKEKIDRAKCMLENIESINEESIKNYKTIEPFYLKKSQAEREYDEKHGVK